MALAHIRTLAAFGLHPDEPVTWQSQRGELYQAALKRLIDQGDAFACCCSRSDLAASNGIHRRCVRKPSVRKPAFRLHVPDTTVHFTDGIRGKLEQNIGVEVGDFVLRRADGTWAYQLAVVVDDAQQGITEVVRGADLLDSTPRQIFLQQRLDYPTPSYAHLPVVRQNDGSKLSKSIASFPVDASAPMAGLRLAWGVLGQPPQALAGDHNVELALIRAIAEFSPSRLPGLDHILPAD